MQHPVRVAVGDPGQHLVQVQLDEPAVAAQPRVRVHVLLQVQVEELEHEVQLGVGVDDVLEPHDVGVLELFQEGDLPDGRRGHPFLLLLEPDFLEGDRRARRAVAGLVDDAVGALADLLDLLVLESVLLGFGWFFFFAACFLNSRGSTEGGGEKERRRR